MPRRTNLRINNNNPLYSTMDNIEAHIAQDKEILQNPTTSPQQRRHIEHQLEQLERYQKEHPEDHHDPTDLELWCEDFPEADECRIYED